MNVHEHNAHEKKERRVRPHHWFLGAVVVIALGLGARWWLQHRAPASVARPVNSILSQSQDMQSLLKKGNAALREGHFTEPPGDNALEYYRKALAIDPHNAEVKKDLEQLATQLLSQFEGFMKSGNLDEAEKVFASLKQAIPQDARLAALKLRMVSAEVSKAISDGKLDRAKDLVHQAEQSGKVAAQTLKKWEADISAKAKAALAK